MRSADFQRATDSTTLNTVVPHSAAFKEAATQQLPVHIHNPARRPGQKMPSGNEVISALAAELLGGVK